MGLQFEHLVLSTDPFGMVVTQESSQRAGKTPKNKQELESIMRGGIISYPQRANKSNESRKGPLALPGVSIRLSARLISC